MSAPPVGTRVQEGTRCGVVVAHRPQDMVDVTFDDLDYPIRRPAKNLVAVRGNPMPSKPPVFLAAVLTEESKRELYRWWMSQPAAPEPLPVTRMTHMTIKFKPTAAEVEIAPIGKEVQLTVIGWAANADIQAVAVVPNGVTSTKANPHVTFALRDASVPAALSDSLLSREIKGTIVGARGPALKARVGWSDGKMYHFERPGEAKENPGPRGGLSPAERAALPDSDFALPGRRWPIPDRRHAQIAKNYMARGFGRHYEYPKIKKAIYDRFKMNPDALENPKKTDVYDPMQEQFRAVVQGIYESLVSKELGIRRRNPDPFILADGTRPDAKLDPETRRRLLSSAYAIATRQGQKYGWLVPGTQQPTERGIEASMRRFQQKHHAATNRQDYETTLAAVRKSGHFRVVEEIVNGQSHFVVQPRPTHVRIPPYRMTREAAELDAKTAESSFTRWNPRRRNPDVDPIVGYIAAVRALSTDKPGSFPAERYGTTKSDLDAVTLEQCPILCVPESKRPKLENSQYEALLVTYAEFIGAPPDQAKTIIKLHVAQSTDDRDAIDVLKKDSTRFKAAEAALKMLTPGQRKALDPFVKWDEYQKSFWRVHAKIWMAPYESDGLMSRVRYCTPEVLKSFKDDLAIVAEYGSDLKDIQIPQLYTDADLELKLELIRHTVDEPPDVAHIRRTWDALVAREASLRPVIHASKVNLYRFSAPTKGGESYLCRVTRIRDGKREPAITCFECCLQTVLEDQLMLGDRSDRLRVEVERFPHTDYENTVVSAPAFQRPIEKSPGTYSGRVIHWHDFRIYDLRSAGDVDLRAAGPLRNTPNVTKTELEAGPDIYKKVIRGLRAELRPSKPTSLTVESYVFGRETTVEYIGQEVEAKPEKQKTYRQEAAQDAASVKRQIREQMAMAADDESAAYYDVERTFTVFYMEEDPARGEPRKIYKTIAMRPNETRAEAIKRVRREQALRGTTQMPENLKIISEQDEIRYVIYIRRDPQFLPRLARHGASLVLAPPPPTRGSIRAGRGDAPGPGQGDFAPPERRQRRADSQYTSTGVASHGISTNTTVIYPAMILDKYFTVDPAALKSDEEFLRDVQEEAENGDSLRITQAEEDSSIGGFDTATLSGFLGVEETPQEKERFAAFLMHAKQGNVARRGAKAAEDTGRWMRKSPDKNWVPYRSRTADRRKLAKGRYDPLENRFVRDTTYTKPHDVFFTTNPALAYLTILFFNNPRAMQNFQTEFLEVERYVRALPPHHLRRFQQQDVEAAESDRVAARLQLENTQSEPVRPWRKFSMTEDELAKTQLGMMFILGLREAVLKLLMQNQSASGGAVPATRPPPTTIQGQRGLSGGARIARALADQEARDKRRQEAEDRRTQILHREDLKEPPPPAPPAPPPSGYDPLVDKVQVDVGAFGDFIENPRGVRRYSLRHLLRKTR